MTDLILTILGISSIVAIMSSIISSYLQETTKDELFTSNWRDSLEPWETTKKKAYCLGLLEYLPW